MTILAACPGGDDPKPAVAVEIVQGTEQTAVAGTAVAVTPTIKVVDEDGNGVGGATFHFTVLTGGGSVTTGTGIVGPDGLATPGSWKLGTKAGSNTLGASVEGIGTPMGFSATGTAGPAARLVVATQPGNANACGGVATQPVIRIVDANDNLTTSNAAVTASIASGDGTLSGTTTVNAIAGTATFTNLVVTGSGAVTLSFTSAGLTSATSSGFTAVPHVTQPFNLTIDGLYLTQATQDYAGTVPLIASRAALLRVFVKASATNTSTPTVKVTTLQSGTPFKTYMIASPSQSVPMCVDEGNLTASWNVAIPASEVVPNMSVLAEVDPTNAVTESSDSDNKFPSSGTPKALDVRTAEPMRITFIPVTQGGGTGNISAANVDAYLDFARRVYPWSSVDYAFHAPYTYGTTLNGTSYDAGWSTLLNEIDAMRKAERNQPGQALNRYYYAVVRPSYNSGGTGYGQIGGAAAIGVDVKFNGTVQPSTNYYSMTLAHELGHNFGRNHIACGNPSNPDGFYPYSPTTSIGVYGWDPAFNLLRGKDSYTDFMSYCSPLWISDYTYKAVLNWRESRFGPPGGVARKSLLVWGRMGPSGIVLEPAFEIDAPPSLPERAGRYSVQAVDGEGREVFSISFDGAEVDHSPGERNFAYVVPLPANGQILELRLRDGQSMMARRPRTTLTNAAVPGALASVRMRSLSPARSRLEWDASTYPMAMVRDPVTHEVLGFLRGGSGELGGQRAAVDVLFSNGVSSTTQRVQITR